MFVVCYDVDTTNAAGARRLRRIAKACEDYGVRVQYSVFECDIGLREWTELRNRLLEEFDATTDSLRFYCIADRSLRAEHHGVRKPVDVKGPLIF